MDANEFIQANNLQPSFASCPTFRDWPVARNRAGKLVKLEKVTNELHAGKNDLADRAAAQGDGLLPRPDEAVASALWTVSVRPTFVRRFGRGAA